MFQPLHTLVTVVLDKKADKTSGGLVLPDTFADVFLTGTVRAIGHGRKDEPLLLNPGDRVMLAQHTQQGRDGSRRVVGFPEIEDDGVKCIFCDYAEILGVLK